MQSSRQARLTAFRPHSSEARVNAAAGLQGFVRTAYQASPPSTTDTSALFAGAALNIRVTYYMDEDQISQGIMASSEGQWPHPTSHRLISPACSDTEVFSIL